MKNALLFENFQDDDHFQSFWTHSSSNDFPGRFKVGKGGDNPAISSELGLFVPREAQRYAIFGETTTPFDLKRRQHLSFNTSFDYMKPFNAVVLTLNLLLSKVVIGKRGILPTRPLILSCLAQTNAEARTKCTSSTAFRTQ